VNCTAKDLKECAFVSFSAYGRATNPRVYRKWIFHHKSRVTPRIGYFNAFGRVLTCDLSLTSIYFTYKQNSKATSPVPNFTFIGATRRPCGVKNLFLDHWAKQYRHGCATRRPVGNKRTKKTSHFFVYSRRATHDPHHAWHGDRGGPFRFFLIRSVVAYRR